MPSSLENGKDREACGPGTLEPGAGLPSSSAVRPPGSTCPVSCLTRRFAVFSSSVAIMVVSLVL